MTSSSIIIFVKYKANCNIIYSCKYHVVWCSKYRRKVLVEGVDVKLKEIIHQFVSTVGGAPLSIVKQYIENQKHV